jgi:hypothetical protein
VTVKVKHRGRAAAPTGRRRRALCPLLVLPALFAAPADNPLSEYHVKAAYLLNFTKFVQWPAEAFEFPDSPLSICILGDDPFGAILDQVVEGEAVRGRRLTLQRLRQLPNRGSCQVLFIGASEQVPPDILANVGPGVLTVADREGSLREGVVIAFLIEDRRVRFAINQRAAARASLALDARLLKVARSVAK